MVVIKVGQPLHIYNIPVYKMENAFSERETQYLLK